MTVTKDAVKQGLNRFLRVSVALVVSYWITTLVNDPKYIAIAPLINGFAKWLRDEYSLDLKVI